jgi:transposase
VDPATSAAATSLRIETSLVGYRELMRWSKQYPDRRWAVEGARGRGRHLAQWLVARSDVVLDVPSSATARVRELSRGSRGKTDIIDAAAGACVAALHGDATAVTAEDCTTVFELREERRANVAAQRVRVANQLRAAARPDPRRRDAGDQCEVGGNTVAIDPTRVAGGTHPQGTRPGPRDT